MNLSTHTGSRTRRSTLGSLVVFAAVIGLLAVGSNQLGLGLPAWHNPATATRLDPAADRALPVNTLVARRTESYLQVRSFTGMIKARRTSELSFAQPGRLLALLAQQGEEVREGEALAEQETKQRRLQRDKLEQPRTDAEAELARLIGDSQLRSMEAIRIEVRDLKSELSQIREAISRQQSAEDAAAAPQDPRSETEARLNAAAQRLAILDATSADPRVRAQQALIADLNQQLSELDAAIGESTLRAPFDGVIALQYVSEGTMVSPEVAIMRIVERDAVQAWIGIPLDVADGIRPDETFTIRVGNDDDGSDEAFEADLFAKFPEVDRTTRTRTVVFSLKTSATARPLPGEVARIQLQREVESSGFWLPITALTRQSRGLWSVYAVDRSDEGEQVVSRRYVEVIHLEGEFARVRGTLDDGDLVIADGTHRVVPGQIVEPVTREMESGTARPPLSGSFSHEADRFALWPPLPHSGSLAETSEPKRGRGNFESWTVSAVWRSEYKK